MTQSFQQNIDPLVYGTFCQTFATLSDIHEVLTALEHAFTLPPYFLMGVRELMVNAVEHGNLEIGYDLKTQLLQQGRWQEEIDRRLMLPQNRHKKATLQVTLTPQAFHVEVCDGGVGADCRRFAQQAQEGQVPSLEVLNGRGLHVVCQLAFDCVEFGERSDSGRGHGKRGYRVVAYRYREGQKNG